MLKRAVTSALVPSTSPTVIESYRLERARKRAALRRLLAEIAVPHAAEVSSGCERYACA